MTSSKKAMVDTCIWVLSKKKPSPQKFKSRDEYGEALAVHRRAQAFFRNTFPKLKVYMSLHQVAEIFHVMAFRGARVPLEEALRVVNEILVNPSVVKIPVSERHVKESIKLSAETGIHVRDFLCFIPVKDFVEVIYTGDRHFLRIGEMFRVNVVNPLKYWLKA